MARSAIGPWWDGNEVWLIVAGGATFAAFPLWYASMFSGFYLPLFIILAALIIRGVSFEFRGKRDSARWKAGWDWALAIGSLVPAFAWGVAFTDLVRGLRLSPAGLYLGGLSGLVAPVAIVGGLASLTLFLAHGATFLSFKTGGPAGRPGPHHRDVDVAAGGPARGRHRGVALRRRLPRPRRPPRHGADRPGRRVRAGVRVSRPCWSGPTGRAWRSG